MGGLAKLIPVTYAVMMIGTIAITGLASLTLRRLLFQGLDHRGRLRRPHSGVGALRLLARLVPPASDRLLFLAPALHDLPRHEPRADASRRHGSTSHESPWVMLVPLIVLAVGAMLAGIARSRTISSARAARVLGRRDLHRADNHVLDRGPRRRRPGWPGCRWSLRSSASPSPPTSTCCARTWRRRSPRSRGRSTCSSTTSGSSTSSTTRPSCDPAQCARRPVLEGRRPEDHRRPRPRRRLAAVTAMLARGAGRLQTGYVYHYAFVMLLGVVGAAHLALWAWRG